MFQAGMYESAALARQKKWNEAIKVLESLLKMQLTRGDSDQVMYLLTGLKAGERNDKRWHVSGLAGFSLRHESDAESGRTRRSGGAEQSGGFCADQFDNGTLRSGPERPLGIWSRV